MILVFTGRFEPAGFRPSFEVRDHFFSCFKKFAIVSTSSAMCRFDRDSFFITQFDAQALFYPSFHVFVHCGLENRVEEETTQGVALFCSTSDPEFITLHVSQYGGALVSVQFFNYSLIEWFLRDLQIASCCTESSAFLI